MYEHAAEPFGKIASLGFLFYDFKNSLALKKKKDLKKSQII